VHGELELLVHDGLTATQALAAATSAAARAFRLSDRGHIFPGARADLLLVQGNPTINILRNSSRTPFDFAGLLLESMSI
jgi:imidazolonepropionase-like amidohydrolase